MSYAGVGTIIGFVMLATIHAGKLDGFAYAVLATAAVACVLAMGGEDMSER
jgi:hypothetical protein